jgi:hypothetical protein
MTTERYTPGTLVRKRPPCHPDSTIGTVIKHEIWERKRKDREEPEHVFYYEVLWRGKKRTDWVPQQRIKKVEGI